MLAALFAEFQPDYCPQLPDLCGRLLRHRIVDTTQIYAKVDDKMLAALAQDWPEEPA